MLEVSSGYGRWLRSHSGLQDIKRIPVVTVYVSTESLWQRARDHWGHRRRGIRNVHNQNLKTSERKVLVSYTTQTSDSGTISERDLLQRHQRWHLRTRVHG